jgi:hypothetical protein
MEEIAASQFLSNEKISSSIPLIENDNLLKSSGETKQEAPELKTPFIESKVGELSNTDTRFTNSYYYNPSLTISREQSPGKAKMTVSGITEYQSTGGQSHE